MTRSGRKMEGARGSSRVEVHGILGKHTYITVQAVMARHTARGQGFFFFCASARWPWSRIMQCAAELLRYLGRGTDGRELLPVAVLVMPGAPPSIECSGIQWQLAASSNSVAVLPTLPGSPASSICRYKYTSTGLPTSHFYQLTVPRHVKMKVNLSFILAQATM